VDASAGIKRAIVIIGIHFEVKAPLSEVGLANDGL
jgi:hypothetical protein